jgi:uncharacterized protein with ATP-grasp and redox domains
MRTSLECIPCFVRQALDALRQVCDHDAEIERILKVVLTEIAVFDRALSPPDMGRVIHAVVRQELGHPDPYRAIKQRSTQEALRVMPQVRECIERSERPFHTAVRFAIAGNIMDYALTSTWDKDPLTETLAKAESQPMDEGKMDELKQAIDQAETILWLADNAGETVFDRLLIERLSGKRIIYAVKQSPVINDAIRQDAVEAGLKPLVELIDNGTDAPGTVLSLCAPTFLEAFDRADVVIAKGQANFETLNEVDRDVYFLTQIKCAVIARHYGYAVGDWIVTTPSALTRRHAIKETRHDSRQPGF